MIYIILGVVGFVLVFGVFYKVNGKFTSNQIGMGIIGLLCALVLSFILGCFLPAGRPNEIITYKIDKVIRDDTNPDKYLLVYEKDTYELNRDSEVDVNIALDSSDRRIEFTKTPKSHWNFWYYYSDNEDDPLPRVFITEEDLQRFDK